MFYSHFNFAEIDIKVANFLFLDFRKFLEQLIVSENNEHTQQNVF